MEDIYYYLINYVLFFVCDIFLIFIKWLWLDLSLGFYVLFYLVINKLKCLKFIENILC